MARPCILQAFLFFCLPIPCWLSLGLRFFFFSFCFVFVFLLAFIDSLALRPIVLRYAWVPTATCSYLSITKLLETVCALFSLVLFLFMFSLDMPLFSDYHVPLPFPFPFCMESNLYVFFPGGVFYLVTTGWILTSAYVRIQSIICSFSTLRLNLVLTHGIPPEFIGSRNCAPMVFTAQSPPTQGQ